MIYTAHCSGYFSFNEELEEYTISYHVPGTIDSNWTGIICLNIIDSFDLPEEGRITFTGEFMDDQDRFNPTTQFGGQEFFFLNLISFEEVNEDEPK